jgi:hypothetical protein
VPCSFPLQAEWIQSTAFRHRWRCTKLILLGVPEGHLAVGGFRVANNCRGNRFRRAVHA